MQVAHRNRLSYLACILRNADELTIVSFTTMLSQIISGLTVSINGT